MVEDSPYKLFKVIPNLFRDLTEQSYAVASWLKISNTLTSNKGCRNRFGTTIVSLNFFALILILCLGLEAGCTDPGMVLDKSTEMVNRNWSYANKIKYDINITDPTPKYNLYLNLRVTGDYKYANLFTLISQRGPDGKKDMVRYEFKLANADGEWLGKGTGNIYNYQKLFKPAYTFPAKGVYHFEIEQNMRDNPLHEVSDVGLRIEKAQ